jgi:putative ATP-binding cassette transporter
VISHDDRYFDCADRLIKLDYGKITREPFEKAVAPGTIGSQTGR